MRSVGQPAPSNRLELNDDGTPRRKYEQEESEDSRVVVRTTIGLVLVNAFVLIKNVLFSGDAAQAAGPQGVGREAPPQPSADSEELALDDSTEQGDGLDGDVDDVNAPGHVGSSSSIGLFSSPAVDFDPEMAPIYFRGSGHVASSNDNESLYGARPGRGIGFHGDSIAVTSGSGGKHSGGGGGSHGGGGHGGSSNEDPDSPGQGSGHGSEDNDDDDDDDDQTHDPDTGPNTPNPPRVNRLPLVLAPVVLANLFANEARAITQAELLAHASDPDGDALTVTNLTASSGMLVQTAGGVWMFTPDEGDTSDVVFTYRVSDGKDYTPQIANLDLVARASDDNASGTPGDDTLIGTPDADVIDGLGGNDTIYGREGNDVIFGGDGNDRLLGGDGDDTIFGGAGNDVIFGGRGNDTLSGGDGEDFIEGDEGNDAISGGSSNDILFGGADNDVVLGDAGNDVVRGDDGDDIVDGGAGDDDIDGGAGNDIARGGSGNDQVTLGAGDDIAIAEVGDGDDTYNGGSGVDTYNTAGSSANTVVDLAAGTASSAETGSDTLTGFENVITGAGADTVTGNDDGNSVDAGAGDDTVDLGAGNDTAVATAGDGNDTYDGGAGSDTYDASTTTADAAIDLGAGTAASSDIGSDVIDDFENVATGSGDDTIVCDDADNTVNAGSGSDTVDLGAGDDTVIATAGDGDDTYHGGNGNDTYSLATTTADALIDLISESVTSADVGRDIIVSFENVNGGKGNDTLIANDSRNIFIGGEGDDRFEFHSSASIGHGQGHRDQILDFAVGDRIDIDKVRDEFADDLSGSFQDKNIEKFVILSDPAAVFSQPGELKLQYAMQDGHDVTIIQGNTNYDAAAEFELELAGTYILTDNDFHRA